MKKLLAYILLVCMILSLAACSPATDKQDEIIDNNTTENFNSGAPREVTFESIEELIELKGALTKSGEESKKHLDEVLYLTDFHSKQEIEDFFERIGNLPILHLEKASGYSLYFISYDIDFKIITTTYTNDDGYVKFEHYLPDSKALKNYTVALWESSPEPWVKEKITVFNKPVGFRIFEASKNPAIYRIVGFFDFSDLKVRLTLSNNEKKDFNLEAIEANIVETTINKLIEQNQIK
ncbi:MAG: hypothetical protein IKK13_03440 [Clostridia bacterium]|nr:hypothetical protein [Clostridia bacterium]